MTPGAFFVSAFISLSPATGVSPLDGWTQFIMPFDRPHDLTIQLYTEKLPFGINAALVGFYQSGFQYTGTYEKPSGEPVEDIKNKYAMKIILLNK